MCVCVSVGGWGVQRGPGGPHRHTRHISITPQPKGAHLVHAACHGSPRAAAARAGLTERRAGGAAKAEASVWARDFSEHTVHGNNRRGVRCAISLGARVTPQHRPSPRVTGRRAPFFVCFIRAVSASRHTMTICIFSPTRIPLVNLNHLSLLFGGATREQWRCATREILNPFLLLFCKCNISVFAMMYVQKTTNKQTKNSGTAAVL